MNYIRLDYSYIPVKAFLYNKNTLVKRWSVDEPISLVHNIIDNMDCNGFEKIKIKQTVETITNIFEPKNIRIVSHE